jgi:hypothetical protein
VEAQGGSFLANLRRINWLDSTEVEIGNEASGWWPNWWGGSDEVGKSPYDYIPPPLVGSERKRVLFLTSEWKQLFLRG